MRSGMIPREELEIRYSVLRDAMREMGYDVLLVAGNAESMQRAYIRYLTDWRLWHGDGYAVLPLQGDLQLVLGTGSQAHWAEAAGWVCVAYDKIGEVIRALRAMGLPESTIGVVGLDRIMAYRDIRALTTALPGAQLQDATRLMERVMAIKSPQEIERAAQTYRFVAQALHRLKEVMAPGRTEREVVAEAVRLLAELGCMDGVAHISNEELPYIRPPTDRPIEVDDIIKVQLEFAGPSGYWVELASIFSFREPPERERQYFATILKATERAAALMSPGVKVGDFSRLIEETYREDGWNITGRGIWGFHGIGLNIVEPPFGVPGSEDEIKENMILMVNASALVDEFRWSVFVPDNLVVTSKGGRPLADYKYEWHVLSA